MTARPSRIFGALFVAGLAVAAALGGGGRADAQPAPVGLGTATSFAVLGGTTVTNTGPSVISGNLGVSPGSAVVGFPPGIVNDGVISAANAVAAQAQADLTTAYNDAAGRTPVTSVPADLAGQTLTEGVYGGPTLGLTGTVTLDAQGNPNAVFIFQAGSTLITASNSTVALINGADPCNVYWQVGSSATLGTGTTFIGNVLALTSITANTGATIEGRLLARNGAVTLDTNVVNRPDCAPGGGTTTTTAPGGGTTTTTAPGGGTTTTTAPGGGGGSTTTTAPGGGTTTTTAPGGGGGTTTTIPGPGDGGPGDGGPGNGGPGNGGPGNGGPGNGGPGNGGPGTGGPGQGGPGGGGPETGGPGGGGPGGGGGAGSSADETGRTGGALPRTGTHTAATALAGIIAILVGGAIVLVARRRAARSTFP
jgi:LPXTG-motif cell wall-anchored protein